MKPSAIRRGISGAYLLAGSLPLLFFLISGFFCLDFMLETGEWPGYGNGPEISPSVPFYLLIWTLMLSGFGLIITPVSSLLHYLLSLRWELHFPKLQLVIAVNAAYALFLTSFYITQTRQIYDWLLD